MRVLAIDPGSKMSGYVLWDTDTLKALSMAHTPNEVIERLIDKESTETIDCIAIERIRGYGIVAGDDTFDTCEWIGVFKKSAEIRNIPVHLIPRKDIKRHLCGNTTTNDKYIRQALIDRYGEVGTKRKPGPLFGISGHLWAALAVAVVCADRLAEHDDTFKIAEDAGL